MKKQLYKIAIALILCIVILLPVGVTAEPDDEFAKKLHDIAWSYSNHQDPDAKVAMSIISAMKATEGVNDYQITAYILNGIRESNLKYNMKEQGGQGEAIWQWTDAPRKNALKQFVKDVGDKSGYELGSVETQVAFLLAEMTPKDKKDPNSPAGKVGYQFNGGKAPFNSYYSSLLKHRSEVEASLVDNTVDLTKKIGYDEWQSIKDPTALTLYFATQWERCAGFVDLWGQGGKQAKDMYELISGVKAGGNTNKELDKNLATTMVKAGLWDETEFVSWKEAVRSNLKFEDIHSLSGDSLETLDTWKKDLQHSNNDKFLVKYGRLACLIFGIFFEVWILLIYLAYWFDRVNNFVEIDLLKIITFGRLTISPDESECTFSIKEKAEGSVRTVNHRKILEICIVGLFMGVFIVSGKIFVILNKLVTGILNILN